MSGLQNFLNENKLFHFEGESGSMNLEKVLNEIGYKEDGFKWGSAVERFLQDNPGAVDLLLEFIREHFIDEFTNNPVRDSYEDCECPDCQDDIPLDVEEGDECENCGHVFSSERPNDDIKEDEDE